MTALPTAHARRLEALILDYNGVIGLQPTQQMWARLAALAGWPADQTADFETEFWAHRAPYDAGEISTHAFWTGVLHNQVAAPPGSALLDELRSTDAEMWTHTDEAVVGVLQAAHATGLPMTILSNAPHPLAEALDRAPWCSTLISKTVYSARLGVNKPDPRAYEPALVAAGSPLPANTLFVDDRHGNCGAAAQLGLRTLHFNGDSQTLAAHIPQLVPASLSATERGRFGSSWAGARPLWYTPRRQLRMSRWRQGRSWPSTHPRTPCRASCRHSPVRPLACT